MHLDRIWLTEFRNYATAELELGDGLTVIVGQNGQGKTNLLEAVGYLALMRSFRGAPTEALIRDDAPAAVVRAAGERLGRSLLVEAELRRTGRNRVQLNRQPLRRARDLVGTVAVTVFAPDDLVIVKGGPAHRREFLDDLAVTITPGLDRTRTELDKVLRQRNALLRQSGGRLTDDVAATLDVWDAKMIDLGGRLIAERRRVLELLEPALEASYRTLASAAPEVRATYVASTGDQDLATALAEARRDDLRRGVSTVGPHRDDLAVTIDDRDTRTRASQGEQRSLALAAKLASHHVATEHTGTAPILLLDDVFSELDVQRSRALVTHLPAAQTLLSTAAGVPGEVAPQQVLRVDAGRLVTGSA